MDYCIMIMRITARGWYLSEQGGLPQMLWAWALFPLLGDRVPKYLYAEGHRMISITNQSVGTHSQSVTKQFAVLSLRLAYKSIPYPGPALTIKPIDPASNFTFKFLVVSCIDMASTHDIPDKRWEMGDSVPSCNKYGTLELLSLVKLGQGTLLNKISVTLCATHFRLE